MPLLNYTTTVPVPRTVQAIQSSLARAGARQVLASYDDDQEIVGLSFVIDGPLGRRAYSLPVCAEQVQAVLDRQRLAPRYQGEAHARRVAWRIVKDWLDAQLALLETEMVTLDQVMLPYMHADGVPGSFTVYELYLARAAGELTPGGDSDG